MRQNDKTVLVAVAVSLWFCLFSLLGSERAGFLSAEARANSDRYQKIMDDLYSK